MVRTLNKLARLPAIRSAVCQGCHPANVEFRYGIDGNWSAFSIFVGEPAQPVDVAVSTALSEIWVVGEGGCGPSTCFPPPIRRHPGLGVNGYEH